MEQPFVDFKCPHCGRAISFPEANVGQPQECPLCSETVIVPAPGAEFGIILPIPIQTQRLALRRLVGTDWKDLSELMGDEESFHHTDWNPMEPEEVEDWLKQDATRRLTQPQGTLCLGIELLENPKLIGFVFLYCSGDNPEQAGLTIFINRNHRRQGFGAEATRAMLEFGFNGINLRRFSVGVDSRNTAGCRLLETVGMRREGEFVKARWVKGEWVNTAWYAMLKEEFGQAPPKKVGA